MSGEGQILRLSKNLLGPELSAFLILLNSYFVSLLFEEEAMNLMC